MNLFAYGTLMDREIFGHVTGKPFDSENAVLEGFSRYRIKEKLYPAIIPEPGSATGGVVYYGLDADAVEQIDRFEGDMYFRMAVAVRTETDTDISAAVYVFREEFRQMLSASGWDFQDFVENRREAFIRTYFGFSALRK